MPTRDGGHDKEPLKDAPAVYSLTFALRSSDVPPPPKGLELAAAGLEAARRKSEPQLTVDVTPGHARVALHEGFVLPEGTEVRVRSDRYGYIIVAPEGDTYRIGPTGSLRAILSEGLFDAAPTSAAEVTPRGEGAHRLGRATRHVDVTTRVAKASFEMAHVPEIGDGGVLLCRALLDLMNTKPSTSVCGDGDVPLHVELRWTLQPPQAGEGRGRISGVSVFDAVSFVKRTDLQGSAFLAPPATAGFVATGEPVRGAHLFLARADLTAMRTGNDPPSTKAGENGAVLSLHNSTDELRYLWLDGVPLAWLAPGGRLDVSGIPHPRATVQWRTFLGEAIDATETVTLPAMVDARATPAGTPSSSDNPPP